MPIATDGDLVGELVGRSFAGDFVVLLAGDGELRADGMGSCGERFESWRHKGAWGVETRTKTSRRQVPRRVLTSLHP